MKILLQIVCLNKRKIFVKLLTIFQTKTYFNITELKSYSMKISKVNIYISYDNIEIEIHCIILECIMYYSMIIFIPSYPENPPVEPVCDVDGLTMVGTVAPGGGSPVP